MIRKINFNNFLFLLLMTSFVLANSLIHLATILIILRCLCLFLNRKFEITFFKNIPKTILHSLALFFASATVTNLLKIDNSVFMSTSFREYKWIAVFIFYVFYLSNFFKRKWVDHTYIVFIFASIIGIYSIAQFFIGFDPFGEHQNFMGSAFPFRAIGLFGMPITFSYMIGGIFFLFLPHIYSNFKSFTLRNKILSSFALTLMFLTVLVTQTRISWVAFYFTFLMMSIFYLKKFRTLAM